MKVSFGRVLVGDDKQDGLTALRLLLKEHLPLVRLAGFRVRA